MARERACASRQGPCTWQRGVDVARGCARGQGACIRKWTGAVNVARGRARGQGACTMTGGVHVTRGLARLPKAATMARAFAMRTDSDLLVTLPSARERGLKVNPGDSHEVDGRQEILR